MKILERAPEGPVLINDAPNFSAAPPRSERVSDSTPQYASLEVSTYLPTTPYLLSYVSPMLLCSHAVFKWCAARN